MEVRLAVLEGKLKFGNTKFGEQEYWEGLRSLL
jgi:hypothetical protein